MQEWIKSRLALSTEEGVWGAHHHWIEIGLTIWQIILRIHRWHRLITRGGNRHRSGHRHCSPLILIWHIRNRDRHNTTLHLWIRWLSIVREWLNNWWLCGIWYGNHWNTLLHLLVVLLIVYFICLRNHWIHLVFLLFLLSESLSFVAPCKCFIKLFQLPYLLFLYSFFHIIILFLLLTFLRLLSDFLNRTMI